MYRKRVHLDKSQTYIVSRLLKLKYDLYSYLLLFFYHFIRRLFNCMTPLT